MANPMAKWFPRRSTIRDRLEAKTMDWFPLACCCGPSAERIQFRCRIASEPIRSRCHCRRRCSHKRHRGPRCRKTLHRSNRPVQAHRARGDNRPEDKQPADSKPVGNGSVGNKLGGNEPERNEPVHSTKGPVHCKHAEEAIRPMRG